MEELKTTMDDLNKYTKESFDDPKRELEKLIKEFDYKLRKYISGSYEINIKAYSSLSDDIYYNYSDFVPETVMFSASNNKGVSISEECDRIPIKNKEDSKDIKKYMKDYYGEKYDEE